MTNSPSDSQPGQAAPQKMTVFHRVLLLLTGLLAAYQIAIGIDGLSLASTVSYTISFGILLLAGLLMIVMGFEVLDSSFVVIAATIIPLSLSLGMVWQYAPAYRIIYLVFCLVGFLLVSGTRLLAPRRLAIVTLSLIHGVAGVVITFLPFTLIWRHSVSAGFGLVGVGGLVIGITGVLFSFLKAGRPILTREEIFHRLPGLLFLMTAAFVCGFSFG